MIFLLMIFYTLKKLKEDNSGIKANQEEIIW